MAYTTVNKSSDYFNTVLYTGNGTDNHAITGVGFQPNFIWVKARSASKEHRLQNSVVGITNHMRSNANNEETAGSVKTADSDGFTLGTSLSWNENTTTYAAWNWLAGTAFSNDASATSIGTIDSTGTFNNDSGVSIVSYTGTGTAGTVKHGMNSTPKMIIVKRRDTTGRWQVYHHGTDASSPEDKYLFLDGNEALLDHSNRWNDTAPTSSVFSLGNSAEVNNNGGTYIAYCFAEKQGFSKFGSFEGNGNADGPFVHLGFRPAFIVIKKSSGTEDWSMYDTKRNVNGTSHTLPLVANDNGTESGFTGKNMDILSNGVKILTSNGELNLDNETYIYWAFAEHPFVSSTGTPVTAR